LRPNTLNIKTGKSPSTVTKSSSASTKPSSSQEKPEAVHAKGILVAEERRRSQRVLLRVRACIHVALHGQPATYDVTTLSVNNHGALVVMERSLPLDTRLVLEHGSTRERVACKVSRPAREMPEGYHVPLEFDSPAPDFWKIAFPPANWRPDDI